jgi:hypothetical protein
MEQDIAKKPSIFSKIKPKYDGIKKDLVIFVKKVMISEEYSSVTGMIGEIVLYGVLSNLALIPLGSYFGVIPVLSFGSGFWLIKEKVVPMISLILSSIKLVTK